MDNLFEYSLNEHQKLIRAIVTNSDNCGICKLSQKDLGLIIGKSQSWVGLAIGQINIEDTCILCNFRSYRVVCPDLVNFGTFSKLRKMLQDSEDNLNVIYMSDDELMMKYSVRLKTVQMYRAYLLTGHNLSMKKLNDVFASNNK